MHTVLYYYDIKNTYRRTSYSKNGYTCRYIISNYYLMTNEHYYSK